MSRKQRKSGNKSDATEKAGLATAIISLLTAIVALVKELIS